MISYSIQGITIDDISIYGRSMPEWLS